MKSAIPESRLPDGLILARDLNGAFGDAMLLPRLAARGEIHRIARGAYFRTNAWSALDSDSRYELRVRAASLQRRGSMVLSHHSAGVLWGIPILRGWPDEVHFLTERASGGRSDPGVRRHALGIDPDDVTVLDGLPITTVRRTVVDLAAALDVKSAVAAIDYALHIDRFERVPPLTTKPELLDAWERMLPFRGSVRARSRIEFGTEHADSPAESASRVNIALCGFPEPELQHPFMILDGTLVETDFYWPDQDAVGECDGFGKYSDPRLLGRRGPEQVVYDEKIREDAIREQVRGFTRWNPPIGMSQYRLRAKLLGLGLPLSRPRQYPK